MRVSEIRVKRIRVNQGHGSKIDERAVIMRYGGLAKVGSTVWMAGVAPTGYL